MLSQGANKPPCDTIGPVTGTLYEHIGNLIEPRFWAACIVKMIIGYTAAGSLSLYSREAAGKNKHKLMAAIGVISLCLTLHVLDVQHTSKELN